jgi:tetratricopeptide (TPR) repeat protein
MMSNTMPSSTVRAWLEEIVIPTYPVLPPDRNPMFLEKRVYQGSSGKVYPNPFTDRVSDEKRDQTYHAIFLENEYLRLMILPEIGGRIHIGQDKTNGYDFFYRQNVIKPALVGLLGPWISGGVEFNWPQHHRPSTYMPVHWEIEESPDGSRTVWLSEHEPMQRMKGMVGICLNPGKAFLEAKVRLYNRTPFTQTFLWWANVGIRVHDQYQAFFPPDVTFVADHAKRAMSSFPLARNFYYGVDYRQGVDLSWYKNIPVPTSYMVTQSNYNFFGGYDYQAQAGVVHVADRFVAPGKKLWTWGNGDFGYAWDRELTDSDGPYIELMAGVYTDNQPDFSWLLPYETRTFRQVWYPIQQIGPAKNANEKVAINLERRGEGVHIGACVTEPFAQAKITLASGSQVLFETKADIQPGTPFLAALPVAPADPLTLRIVTVEGNELITWTSQEIVPAGHIPDPATEPPPPEEIATVEELYLTGLHLEQYRHATRDPDPYWQEALRRDSLDSRCNVALGKLLLRRGLFQDAQRHLARAIERLTARNPNPATGEAHYYLGVAWLLMGREKEASAAFYKATWNYEWRSAASFQLARLEARHARWPEALDHVGHALATNQDHLHALSLQSAVLRRLERVAEAHAVASRTQAKDPLDFLSRFELLILEGPSLDAAAQRLAQLTSKNVQLHLDLAFDYAASGFVPEARALLSAVLDASGAGYPMVAYFFSRIAGTETLNGSPDYCFPSRLEEMKILEAALRQNPQDAKAAYYLGNLYYDRKRYEEAIALWEKSVAIDPDFSIPWRNLGIAYFNIRRDAAQSLVAYEKARAAAPEDARLLYEFDQLRKRIGASPADRLVAFEQDSALVAQRDDLTVELVTLLNQTGQPEQALKMILGRRFHPWEGGEGLVSGQYVWAHRLLGMACLDESRFAEALEHFRAAKQYPQSLGEGKHLLVQEFDLDYFSGVALMGLGKEEMARESWTAAVSRAPSSPSMSYYQVLALRGLGKTADANHLLDEMKKSFEAGRHTKPKIDYFATSLPNFLVFEDDLDLRKEIDDAFTEALIALASGEDAISLLRRVLEKEPSHLAAQSLLEQTERGEAYKLVGNR